MDLNPTPINSHHDGPSTERFSHNRLFYLQFIQIRSGDGALSRSFIVTPSFHYRLANTRYSRRLRVSPFFVSNSLFVIYAYIKIIGRSHSLIANMLECGDEQVRFAGLYGMNMIWRNLICVGGSLRWRDQRGKTI